MKKIVKKIGPKFLKKIKPIDTRLRRFPAYQVFSNEMHIKYHSLFYKGTKAETYYSLNYNKEIKKTILFDSFWGRKIGCNSYALYKEIKESPIFSDYNFVWVRNENVNAPFDVESNERVSFVKYNSDEYIETLLSSEIIITNMTLPAYFAPKPAQKIYTPWHGIPLKTLGIDSDIRLAVTANTQRTFNISAGLFSAGPYSTQHIYKYGYRSTLALDRVHETGSPRVDLMLSANKDDIKSNLGITSDKPILLYAPTWRGQPDRVSADIKDQIEAVQSIQENFSETHEIFVSLHHLTKHKMGSLNVPVNYVPDTCDTTEFLAVTDVLITDYSSIMFDYMVLDKPLILHVPDLNDYLSNRGLYCELAEIPASISKNTDELVELIKLNQKPSTFPQYDKAVKKFIPNEDGNSSKRAVKVIEDDLNRDPFEKKNHKKTILLYAGAFKLNGITTSLLNLTNNIDYSKWDVLLIVNGKTVDGEPERYEIFRKLNPNVKVVVKAGKTITSPHNDILYAKFLKNLDLDENETELTSILQREFRRVLGNNHIDIAIDFDGYSGYWSTFIGVIPAKIKAIYQHNDLYAEAFNKNANRQLAGLRSVFRRYKYYDKIISVSKQVKEVNDEKLKDFYPENCALEFVNNSISVDNIITSSKSPLSLNLTAGLNIAREKDIIKFINIARLSPEKNQARLIKAFSRVINAGHEAVLFIVGYGPEEKKLKALTRKLSLSHKVIFTGRLTNPYPLLSLCDCHVLSSNYEGQGIVLLEAMTLGVPCISTDVPAVHSIIGEGIGTICEMNDVSLSKAMIKFIKSEKRAPAFNPVEYANKAMQEFYEKVCSD